MKLIMYLIIFMPFFSLNAQNTIICDNNKYVTELKSRANIEKLLGNHHQAIKYLSLYHFVLKRDVISAKRPANSLLKEWLTNTYTLNEIKNALSKFNLENIKVKYYDDCSSAEFHFLDIKIWTRYDNEEITDLSKEALKQWYLEKLKNSDLLKRKD